MNLRPINIIAYTPCFYKSFFAKIHRWPKEADGGAVPGDRGKGSGDEKAGILLKRIDFSF